jgi:hypothetical protein
MQACPACASRVADTAGLGLGLGTELATLYGLGSKLSSTLAGTLRPD